MSTVTDLRNNIDHTYYLDSGVSYTNFSIEIDGGQMDTEYTLTIGEVVKSVSNGDLQIQDNFIIIPINTNELEVGNNICILESESKIAGIDLHITFNFKVYERN